MSEQQQGPSMRVARGLSVQITTKLHLWWTWLRIAARHVGAAKRARVDGAIPHSFEGAGSAALSAEFESALVAIAAVSFAMEAMDLELGGAGHELDESRFTAPKNATRGFYIAQRLVQVFDLDATQAERLTHELTHLFGLRNESLHFRSVERGATRPHPSGTFTAAELTVYTREEAQDALRVGVSVLHLCATAVTRGTCHTSSASIAREIHGVVKMLEEVVASEGVELATE